MRELLANWNNYPIIDTELHQFQFEDQLQSILNQNAYLISRGNGRCYGDASLGSSVVSMLGFNKILAFDENTGIITCQSGILLSDILEVILPRGWFLPVTPGTRFITLGGAVASDIHGKNHHKEGAISQHIRSMRIMTPDGAVTTCSATQNSELFWYTCGGMGLTGFILDVTFDLKKVNTGFIRQLQIKAKCLDEVLDLFDQCMEYTYSVAWIDCLKTGSNFGRSILMLGEHAEKDELKNHNNIIPNNPRSLSVPFNFPSIALNSLTVRTFNTLFYGFGIPREKNNYVPYQSFFYPLDAVLSWNRIYGSRGFVQYQFVIPKEIGRKGITDILMRISEKRWGSFLAVLKLFGKDTGPISFQMEGYTLALDFARHRSLFPFLDELDCIVRDYGGRLYLTKDARMKAEIFHTTYPNAAKFTEFVNTIDPARKIVSSLSQRLNIK